MCFQLYVGTTEPLPRREWSQAAADISVLDLNEREQPVKAYFSKHVIQYVGSTSGCGCDFPHLMFQNGGWPAPWEEKNPEQAANDQRNQHALVSLLQGTEEDYVELYGVWSGDFSEPKNREEISVEEILKSGFYFKEQGFYKVNLRVTAPAALPSL